RHPRSPPACHLETALYHRLCHHYLPTSDNPTAWVACLWHRRGILFSRCYSAARSFIAAVATASHCGSVSGFSMVGKRLALCADHVLVYFLCHPHCLLVDVDDDCRCTQGLSRLLTGTAWSRWRACRERGLSDVIEDPADSINVRLRA